MLYACDSGDDMVACLNVPDRGPRANYTTGDLHSKTVLCKTADHCVFRQYADDIHDVSECQAGCFDRNFHIVFFRVAVRKPAEVDVIKPARLA